MAFVIVTGVSGAGKSRAANSLEDIGFYCVDNMPPSMLPAFLELCHRAGGQLSKVAVVTDIRGGELFNDIGSVLDQMLASEIDYKILFLDVSDEVAIRRYKETRRKHPLGYSSVAGGVKEERELLKAVLHLLWSDKDREEWFSLGENHVKILGFGLDPLRNRYSGSIPDFYYPTLA